MTLKPIRLEPWFREMIWGTASLDPWFPRQDKTIGEVWFSANHNRTGLGVPLGELGERLGPALRGTRVGPERFPILMKFIFPAERLSVQVHPSDEDAARFNDLPGKTEMWHVLRTEPGAEIGLGLREPATRERLREAALSGEIETMLRWIRVRPGDTFFVSPGTVHAIGPGVVICEIQQHSDRTYRLYDYRRGRELHLDKGVAVANLEPHPGACTPVALAEGRHLLACCPYFATESIDLTHAEDYAPDAERCHFLVVLEGNGRLGEERYAAGQAWLVPATAEPFALEPDCRTRVLRTYVPE